jgi:hypothetical protein
LFFVVWVQLPTEDWNARWVNSTIFVFVLLNQFLERFGCAHTIPVSTPRHSDHGQKLEVFQARREVPEGANSHEPFNCQQLVWWWLFLSHAASRELTLLRMWVCV